MFFFVLIVILVKALSFINQLPLKLIKLKTNQTKTLILGGSPASGHVIFGLSPNHFTKSITHTRHPVFLHVYICKMVNKKLSLSLSMWYFVWIILVNYLLVFICPMERGEDGVSLIPHPQPQTLITPCNKPLLWPSKDSECGISIWSHNMS
jgi:hypothetical protein